MSTCADCRYFFGECRRYPPVLFLDFSYECNDGKGYKYKAAYPDTNTVNWCGEWKGIPHCHCKESCQCAELRKILDDHHERHG